MTIAETRQPSQAATHHSSIDRLDREVNAVVIGGGLGGLAAAAELLTRGFHVTLIEQNEHLGGKMNVLTEETPKGTFTFDMGPTILTLPAVVRGILARAGKDPADYIDLVRLDPQWRCFYADGVRIDLLDDPDAMARSLDQQFPGAGVGDGFNNFVDHARRMFRLSESVFFYKDVGEIKDLAANPPKNRPPGLMRDVLAMRMHSTVAATIHKHIKEPHLAQLCEHFLQYVGSSPFLAPAILTLIAAAQTDQGCWYSMGGTRSVARALERLITEAQTEGRAKIMCGVGVRSLERRGDSVEAAVLEDGTTIPGDVFVSNCDVQRTHRDLLGQADAIDRQKQIASKYTPACSGVVFYLGLDRQYDHLAHHEFLFSSSSKDEFDDIYRKGIPAQDPTLYLAVPSRTDPGQAPEGCEALYILIHTPYLRPGQDDADLWGQRGEGKLLDQYRSIVMNTLKTTGGMPDIEDHILVEKHLTPNMIDRMYNAEGGAIYGLASHGRLKGGFKPRNRSKLAKNLYFTGGSVNPGPGVPMVLMSGVTAARAVAEDHGLSVPDAQFTADNQTLDAALPAMIKGKPASTAAAANA